MTKKQLALRILATGVVLAMGASALLLTGCATVFPPEPVLTIAAGSSICTAPTLAECERLSKIAASLNTPEFDRLIKEAQAFEVVRK